MRITNQGIPIVFGSDRILPTLHVRLKELSLLSVNLLNTVHLMSQSSISYPTISSTVGVVVVMVVEVGAQDSRRWP